MAFLQKINPTREEFVSIYKYIKTVGEVSVDRLYMKMIGSNMNYCKLKLCIDAFAELGLIKFVPSVQKIKIIPVTEKVDLNSSKILNDLRCKISKGGN